MARFLFILAVSMSLAGCAASVKEVVGPSGQLSYSLGCAGMGRTKESCYKKAGELCPSGYRVEDDNTLAFGRQSVMLISCR